MRQLSVESDHRDRDANPPLREYRDAVRYLARIPEWGGRSLEFQLGKTVERWSVLDPAARQYVPDRLRGSPMLNYGAVLDRVVEDLNALAGIQHEIMGERVSAGFARTRARRGA
jgi:hypothetical protein